MGDEMAQPYSADTCGASQEIGKGVSVGATIATASGYIGIHCNVSGIYRVYAMDGTSYEEPYLVAGGVYGYACSKITDINGNALTDHAVIAIIA